MVYPCWSARQHLHILKRLDAKPGDESVVRIIERCLPPAVSSKWQDQLEMNELPRLDDLFKFLQKMIFKYQASDEASKYSSNQNNRKRVAEQMQSGPAKNSKTNGRTLVTTSVESSPSADPQSANCLKCCSDHRLFKCPEFNNLKTQERWDFVKLHKLCRNCLSFFAFLPVQKSWSLQKVQ